jgi:hypothetical protein
MLSAARCERDSCDVCVRACACARSAWLVPGRVMAGNRPPLPTHERYESVSALIRRCWARVESERPTARELRLELRAIFKYELVIAPQLIRE